MAIDTSIYGLIQAPKFQSPLEGVTQAMTVGALMNQSKLQDIQLRTAERGERESQQIRDLFAGGQPVTAEQIMAVSPEKGIAYAKSQAEAAKARAELQKVDRENFVAMADDARRRMQAIRTPEQWQAFRDEQIRRAGMFQTPEIRNVALQAAQSMPAQFDPNYIRDSLVKAEELFTPKLDQVTMPDGSIRMVDKNPFTNPKAGEFHAAPGMTPAQREQQRHNKVIESQGAARVAFDTSKPKATPGQEAADKEFAKELVAFESGGGADQAKQISQLREVVAALEKGEDNLTGPVLGRVPDAVKAFTHPKAIAMRERVEEVVQRSLRAILGAQFTEKEGERLIARAYNPNLSEEENLVRVKRLLAQLESAFKAKTDAAAYFKENGTLSGWQGKMPSISDFDPDAREAGGKIDTKKTFDSMPDPAQYSGRRVRADDGTIYRSDGKRWVRQ